MSTPQDKAFTVRNGEIKAIESRSMRDGLFGKSLEDALQTLFEDFPEILPGYQIGAGSDSAPRFALLRREMPVGSSWSLDHLYVDQFGVLTLVETKLVQNPESRREVVGQIIEYATNARSSWSISKIVDSAGEYWARRNKLLSEVIADRLGPEIDLEELWKNVESRLQTGQLRLIVAADRIRPEVRRMIEYLNVEMQNVEVLGLEIECYGDDKDELFIVPRLIGQSSQVAEQKSLNRKGIFWTEEKLREALAELSDSKIAKRCLKILDWAKAEGQWMPSVAANAVFGVRSKLGRRLFAIHLSGQIYVYFDGLDLGTLESSRESLLKELQIRNMIDSNLKVEEIVSGRTLSRQIQDLAEQDFVDLLRLIDNYSGT